MAIARSFQTVQYHQRVLATDPVAYWPLDEKQGNVAHCWVDPVQNGAYTGVTLGQPGIGDGRTCPLFDGLNDFVNIHTATFDAAFDGDEGSVAMWFRAFNAAVWADGNDHFAVDLAEDANNRIYCRVAQWDGVTFNLTRIGGGGLKQVNPAPGPSVTWIHTCLTWSRANDAMRAYIGGAQTGATQVGLLAWAGTLTNGARLGSEWWGGSFWHGWLAHCAVWDRPLTPAQVADLAVVE